MRRWILSLLGVAMLVAGGTSQAFGHGAPWGPGGHCGPHGGHHAYWRGYYGAPRVGYGYGLGYGGYGGYGGCGAYPAAVPYGYGYGAGYGAYPAAGLGLATRNFSFWLQP